MRSKIYIGSVLHKRYEKIEHKFIYPTYFYALDLDELELADKKIFGFGYNRFSLSSIYDKDYLNRGEGTIREKLDQFLEPYDLVDEISRVTLITSARYLNYVFNPVSFYYCYSSKGQIICIVMEVNNTFGERHLYILNEPSQDSDGKFWKASTKKEFHVSPFFDREGQYECSFSSLDEKLSISIDLIKEQKIAIATQLKGDSKDFTTSNYLKSLLKFPFTTLLTVTRIHLQAIKLYFYKKVNFYKKPIAKNNLTIRKKNPGFLTMIAEKIVLNVFSKISIGRLEIILPEGQKFVFAGAYDGPQASMKIYGHKFFNRLILDANIGFAESFIEGEWESDEPLEVLKVLSLNKHSLSLNKGWLSKLGGFVDRLKHLRRRNTKMKSRENISQHYDLSNDFFSLFLDSSMTYSCGVFKSSDDSLGRAQKNKVHQIIEKAHITKDCHVLEVGCGWGAFAIEAVKKTGCRVTGITLSKEQLAYAKRKVELEGLTDKINLKLCDYRDMKGKFDRIVSIEMLEAVGHEYFGVYFQSLDRLLNPDGLVVIQVITIPDQRYESYLRGCDFIQKYIFPGGLLPSFEILSKTMTKHSQLHVEHLENIGPDYARTLHLWHDAFKEKREQFKALGWDKRAQRIWEYYFMYCEAGFVTRNLDTLQLVLTRSRNQVLMELDKKKDQENESELIYS